MSKEISEKENFFTDRQVKKKVNLATAVALFLLLLFDQVSKYYIEIQFTENRSLTVIPGFFYIDKVYNRGAAFSFLANKDWGIYLLSALSVMAGLTFVYLLFRSRSWKGRLIFLLISSGTLGNGIDRVFRAFVIDFIELHFGDYLFPSFNVADSLLVVGCILLLLFVIWGHYDPELDLGFKEALPQEPFLEAEQEKVNEAGEKKSE